MTESQFDIYWQKLPQDKLWHYVRAIKTEVGGFGYARQISACEVVVEDVWLAPQYVSHSEVDFIDGDGVAYAINKAADDGRLGEDDFVWVSWHSHNTMKAFWSGTDEACINGYGKSGIKRLLSIVGNHKLEYSQRLDFFNVKHDGFALPQVTFDDLTLLSDPADPAYDIYDVWNEELKEMIKEKPKTVYVPGKTQMGSWKGGKWAPNPTKPSSAKSTTTSKPGDKSDGQTPTPDAQSEKLYSSLDATAYRSNAEGDITAYNLPGVGWVDEHFVSDANEYDSEMLELGRAVAVAITNNEISFVECNEEEKEAVIAFYDVIGNRHAAGVAATI